MSKFSQGASKIKVVFYYLIVFQVMATNCLELHLLLVWLVCHWGGWEGWWSSFEVGIVLKYTFVTGYQLSCFILYSCIEWSSICHSRVEEKLM